MVTLRPDAAYLIGPPGAATVTIVSDDAAPSAAVALYPFSEGAGPSTADATGNGNTGTITAATWAPGKYGQGLRFNGSTAYVTVPDAASLDLGSTGTVEAWVRPEALNVWHGIVAKGSAKAQWAHNYAIEITSANRVECGVGNGTAANAVQSTITVAAGTLYHLACVWTGSQLLLYVNGALNTSGLQTIAPAGNTAPLYVGQYGGNVDRTNGLIDEVRVYGTALPQAQVQADMNTPIAPPAPDTTNPTVTLTAPANGATVSGSVTVTANASDDVGVAGVQFKLDGANLGSEGTVAPYAVTWGTLASANGSHVLTATARDAAGNTATSASVTVTVANDKTAPTVPANLAAVPASSTQVNLSWGASTDNVGVTGYRIKRNGAVVATTAATTYADTGLTPQTAYTYVVAAFDAANNFSADSAPVTATTPAPPPPTGLAAAYRFGEGTATTTADLTANGNVGTLVNGAAWTVGGKYGGAISFDGVDDHVRVADSASLDLGATGTIEAWVKVTTLNRWHGVIAKGSANFDPSQNYALEITNANRWVCIVGNGTSAVVVQSSVAVPANQFVHAACAWNGTALQLYVNGGLNASATESITPAGNTSPLYVGQFGGNADRLNGIVDEVRIYGRALTPSEIQLDMNTPL